MTRSLAFLVLSSLSLIFPSTLALSPSSSSTPSPIPLQGTSLFCTPTTQCTSCPPSEMNTELCKLWGNRRQLKCSKSGSTRKGSRPNEEKSIKDPDEQTSHTSTTDEKEKKKESSFYSFEPSETSVREEKIEEEGEEGEGKISKEEKELVEEELRDAVNAERSLRRALGEEEEGEEEVLVWEACPRIVKKEQSDYFEFLLCNLFFGLSGLGVLLYRQRTLAGRQFGKLAARIMQTEIR